MVSMIQLFLWRIWSIRQWFINVHQPIREYSSIEQKMLPSCFNDLSMIWSQEWLRRYHQLYRLTSFLCALGKFLNGNSKRNGFSPVWHSLMRLLLNCRYTDIVNDDDQVRKLLTSFISGVKNLCRSRHEKQITEHRVMWLVNMIKWV